MFKPIFVQIQLTEQSFKRVSDSKIKNKLPIAYRKLPTPYEG